MFVAPSLTVDLAAVADNWRLLKAKFKGEETAAVVKADAYGLGMIEVTTALEKAGCHTFFVATLEEAIALRGEFPDVRILVFHGVGKGEEFAFQSHKLIPVLNSREQIERWRPVARDHVHAVSALHIDTGMGRLGLQPNEFKSLMEKEPKLLEATRCGLLMSHLACAPEGDHALNAEQLSLFSSALKLAPGIPASLCNSGGIFLGPEYHFNLARPGCSLYGIAPLDDKNPMKQVATWTAPIIQTRTLERDQTVGYGATQKLKKGTRLATVASGYAEGYPRHLSGRGMAYLGDHKVPLVGRVTMDMLTFDVSAAPESLAHEGATLTLLGDKDGIRVDDVAEAAGTIGYEIITRLGRRLARSYQ